MKDIVFTHPTALGSSDVGLTLDWGGGGGGANEEENPQGGSPLRGHLAHLILCGASCPQIFWMSLSNMVDLLLRGGRDLSHSMLHLIPLRDYFFSGL